MRSRPLVHRVVAALFPGVCLGVATCSLAACKDVDDFSTKPDETYCGSIVAGPFVRDGFAPEVKLRLTFDAAAIERGPGLVSTDDGLFTDARLTPIPQLFHDPLATLQFGEGRRRSLLYTLAPTRELGGAPLNAVLSLMEGGEVEVRLFRAGDPAQTATPGYAASYFGVFPLARRKGTCF
jgi:hypothetical protein